MNQPNVRIVSKLTALFAAASLAIAQGQVEPNAGNWKTWVIPSGRDFRVPPPPNAQATREELAWLKEFMAADASNQIRYWNAGPAGYRWMELINNRQINGLLAQTAFRAWAYAGLAMNDATIAAWESKYAYNRARPSETDNTIRPKIAVPASPSYPSDFAASAAAAAEVLAFLIPADAAYFRGLAEEAARSRVHAGIEYPSDYFAGLELGKRVAAQVIAKAQADNSSATFTGPIPTGACMWVGTNPGNAAAPQWRPLALASASEFRPAPPPSCTSPQVQREVADVRNFPRNTAAFTTNAKAMYYQSAEGNHPPMMQALSRYMLEDHWELNPPRAARAYALMGVAYFDSYIASNDGKYAYWYLRPNMLDSAITPLFATPNFPSYPSNHSTFSTTRAEIIAYLFPDRAETIRAIAKEAGDSRIWAGIHYEIDNQSGNELGRKVAGKIIEIANRDGSQ